ncbi:hypothetical protein ACFPH6_06840 [Streptomyces xiangluensis]|uniref:Uncharacterized protein n=1 Tax=Streptomyces xiangluensis TaxID=2665720 RepID=A0ABV8YKH2_9ACTN
MWEILSGLRARAEERRKGQGLRFSQAQVEKELRTSSASPCARGFSQKRISDWAPRDASAFKLPQSASDDRVVALAALWAKWANEPAPGRELQNLLEKARDEQVRERRIPPEKQTAATTVLSLTAEQLEVHSAPLPMTQDRTLPALSPYLTRELDYALQDRLREVLTGGASALLVLTGESSTGKTRALYQAVVELAPDKTLLRPATARDLLSLMADGGVHPGTILWLNEFQRILYDSEGEQAAAGLRLFLDRQPGVAAVATLWQDPYWRELTAQGKPRDPYPHARALLVGAHTHRIRVPSELSHEERAQWRELAVAHRDDRLAYAERAGVLDGRIVQHLSGGPELLDAYLSGPGDHFTRHEHALITAALDANRLGHTEPLPVSLLAEAADGSLAPHHRAAQEDWAAPVLEALTHGERIDGTRTDIRCTLSPLRARRDAAGDLPLYEPTDYLRQHIPSVRADQAGSAALWEALCRHTADVADLERLQDAAWKRGLFRYAADLDRRAAIAGSGDALIRILERTATHPDADLIAHWATAQADLSQAQHVDRLFDRLSAAGAQEAIDTLAHRLIAQTDPADATAVGILATRLSAKGVSLGVIQSLVDSLVCQADEISPGALALALPNLRGVSTDVAFRSLAQRTADDLDPADAWAASTLIRALDAADAYDLLETFAARIAAEAPRIDPDKLPSLMAALWHAGAKVAVHSLIALDPAIRVGLNNAATVLCLLGILRAAEADDAVRTLLNRAPAWHVDLVAKADDIESSVCGLLDAFREMGAMGEFAVLADRASAHMSLEDPGSVTALLELLRSADHEEALSALLRRDLAGHVSSEDSRMVQSLLIALRNAGATEMFEAVAMKLVDDVDLRESEWIEEVTKVLLAVDAERAIDGLVTRAKAEANTGHELLSVLALSEAGAQEAARRLAMYHVAVTDSTELDEISLLAWYCQAAHAPDAVRKLLDQGLVDRADIGSSWEPDACAVLLEAIGAVEGEEAARAFADRAAAGIDLDDTMGIAYLLNAMTVAGLSNPRDVLVRRAAAGASLGHINSVANLLEALMEAGADDAIQDLLLREPASQVDLSWGTSTCEALLSALRKAGSPQAEDFARRARAAGGLPVDSFLPYGLETDGSPSAQWSWGW